MLPNQRQKQYGDMMKSGDGQDETKPMDDAVDDINAALRPDRIVVGVAAYPLMDSETTIGGIAFKFIQRNGDTNVVIIPREECGMIQQIFEDLNQTDWKQPSAIHIAPTRAN